MQSDTSTAVVVPLWCRLSSADCPLPGTWYSIVPVKSLGTDGIRQCGVW